jgi:hypothetical protein
MLGQPRKREQHSKSRAAGIGLKIRTAVTRQSDRIADTGQSAYGSKNSKARTAGDWTVEDRTS